MELVVASQALEEENSHFAKEVDIIGQDFHVVLF
jgi:hypothetical protein